MIVEIIPTGGVGNNRPLVLDASQIVVRQDNGTPIYVCAHYGPKGTYAQSVAGMEDFNRFLRVLGIDMTVVVNQLRMPGPPPGTRLVTGPQK